MSTSRRPFSLYAALFFGYQSKKEQNMENKTTEIIFILDRSGSMHGLEKDTIGSFNSMLEKQKKEAGNAFVSTILFNQGRDVIHDRIPISQIGNLSEKEYATGGSTALYDAIGLTIEHIMTVHRYIRKEDLPEHTLFVIITDGMENASVNYRRPVIRKLIEDRRNNGWEFIFIGANIDSEETADSMGMDRNMAVDYIADQRGTALCYDVLRDVISDYRRDGEIPRNWKRNIEDDFRSR